MEFRDRVDKLSEKYGVISGQLYDYIIYDLGLRLAISHPIMRFFDKEEFRNLEYDLAEHQLRNGYIFHNGRKLESVVNQEIRNYRK